MHIPKSLEYRVSAIRTEPATFTRAVFVYRGKQAISLTKVKCVLFGIAVFVKQGDLIIFKPCKAFGLVFGDSDILDYHLVFELLVIGVYRG